MIEDNYTFWNASSHMLIGHYYYADNKVRIEETGGNFKVYTRMHETCCLRDIFWLFISMVPKLHLSRKTFTTTHDPPPFQNILYISPSIIRIPTQLNFYTVFRKSRSILKEVRQCNTWCWLILCFAILKNVSQLTFVHIMWSIHGHPCGKVLRYPLVRRLGGPYNWSGCRS
jgi:hypothetical protein